MKTFLLLWLLPFAMVPTPTWAEAYQACSLGDWVIQVESRWLKEHPGQSARALALLEEKLLEIEHLLPQDKLDFLRERPIWLSQKSGNGAEYHPSRQWLVEHDRHPDMAGCIEISNAGNFLAWSDNQPMMVLHELAHALHHREYKFGHPPLRRAYAQVKAVGLYDTVSRWQGPIGPAYAMNNHKEYFAELTEACFGLNDIFPYSREQLRIHDPTGYAIVQQMWRAPLKRAPRIQQHNQGDRQVSPTGS